MKKSAFHVAHQNLSVDSKIIASLERISQAFKVLLWNESKEFSLSPIQIQVLIFLLHHTADKRKISYLASEFNLSKPTLSETIKTLEQKGLIKKKSEPLDTRSYSIHLSKKGEAIAQQTSFFTSQIEQPIEKLPAAEKENLLLSLLDIIQHLNKVGIVSVQRMCTSCQYFEVRNKGRQQFCALLNTPLAPTALRLDCDEHKPIVQR